MKLWYDEIEQKKRGPVGSRNRIRRNVVFLQQMQEVAADIGRFQLIRRLAKVFREVADRSDVTPLSVDGKVAELHLLNHAGSE